MSEKHPKGKEMRRSDGEAYHKNSAIVIVFTDVLFVRQKVWRRRRRRHRRLNERRSCGEREKGRESEESIDLKIEQSKDER